MTIYISFKRNDWVFHTGPWLRPFVSWQTNPNVWTFRFWNFQLFVSIFHFDLGISRYCVRCLSSAPWQTGCDIHDFCCRHLWCWWTLVSEILRTIQNYLSIMSPRSTIRPFLLLVLCLQFGILQMTDVHQWGEMNFNAFRPCFIDHLWFVSDSCYVPRRSLFKFLPFFNHCCFCCGYLHLLRQRNKFVYQIVMLQWIVPSSCNMVLMINLVEILPYAFF